MSRSATLCAGVVALALAGCGSSAKSANAPATPTNMRMVLLHSSRGGPTAIEVQAPPAVRAAGGRRLTEFRLGRVVAAQSGCLACHKIGDNGNRGPGPNLTRVRERLSRPRIEHALRRPTAPMPSFRNLPPTKFKAVVTFLSLLRR